MEYIKAIILGIVQGLTEFLPISSSGHLSLFQHFMGMSGEGSLMLTVFLHIGTLIAVVAVYYKTFWKLLKEIGFFLRDLFTGKLFRKDQEITDSRHLLYMMFISCLPLLLLFVPLGGDMNVKDYVERFSEDNDILLEGFCFLVTSILLFTGVYVSRTANNIRSRVEMKDAWIIGFAQVLAAAFPGVSRSGSTISAGMLRRVDKDVMVEYSFVLGTPAVLAASLVEMKDAVEGGLAGISAGPLLVGVITAAVFGILAIQLLKWMVNKDKFTFFAYYCLILATLTIAAGCYEHVTGNLLQF